MPRRTPRLAPVFALATALVAAACAHTPPRTADAGARGPYFLQGNTGDAAACRPDGFLVVHNGESFPVQLVGRPATTGPWGGTGSLNLQPLGPLAGGKTDTIADLAHDLRYVEAQPDGAHAVHDSELRVKNGPPTNPPKNVTFTCTGVARGQ